MSGRLSSGYWNRPMPSRLAGVTVLFGTALLPIGGVYRDQPDLIRSGLMFPALAGIGVFLAVTT